LKPIKIFNKYIKKFENTTLFKKLEDKSQFSGKWTLRFGICVTVIGVPFQIYKNYKMQQCGISIIIILFMLALYSVRIPYSTSKKAYFLLPADFIAFILLIIVLLQYLIYK